MDHLLGQVTTLTFDVFGTVLDLGNSLSKSLERFLKGKGPVVDTSELWAQWRTRQRLEQFQDSLLMLGHSGYLETCRRALTYCLNDNEIEFADDEVDEVIGSFRDLMPFGDAVSGLKRLKGRFKLVALSNGDQWLLEHLVARQIGLDFDRLISVESAGYFKPHPAVYRSAVRLLGADPAELMMVSSHGFDIVGARACGYEAAYVNRYDLPLDESVYMPGIVAKDFDGLADQLLVS